MFKRELLAQNNFGTPQLYELKTDLIAETSHNDQSFKNSFLNELKKITTGYVIFFI